MEDDWTLTQERSKQLFGQVHRLALMAAIARADGRVNPTDLAAELGLAQSAIQAPLAALVQAELLVPVERGRRRWYERRVSLLWDGALEEYDLMQAKEASQKRIRVVNRSDASDH